LVVGCRQESEGCFGLFVGVCNDWFRFVWENRRGG